MFVQQLLVRESLAAGLTGEGVDLLVDEVDVAGEEKSFGEGLAAFLAFVLLPEIDEGEFYQGASVGQSYKAKNIVSRLTDELLFVS